MKIQIIRGDNPIKIYHEPKDIQVHPNAGTVDIFGCNGKINRTYKLKQKELVWIEDKDLDNAEIMTIITVEGEALYRAD